MNLNNLINKYAFLFLRNYNISTNKNKQTLLYLKLFKQYVL